ncbi:helix-turn-helix domain-containing protein [Paraburkholderia sp. MM5496-R1]|uniref:helix-turn-helix domain-containing protein n=1 Tax=Paraburkholderia sp. MM5496-R1 TaxID=2991065 RepID=UPI003D1DD5CB
MILSYASGRRKVCRRKVCRRKSNTLLKSWGNKYWGSAIVRQDPKRIVAVNLRRLRTASGLSQEELADRAGLHRTYVSSIERAQRNLSLENLFSLAAGLAVDVRELLAPLPEDQQGWKK